MARSIPCRGHRSRASKRLPASFSPHKKLAPIFLASACRFEPDQTNMSDMREIEAPPAVSVVVPVRNEAGNIAPLVNEIAAALRDTPRFEIVYVNDGSTDGTRAELGALIASRPWLRAVEHATSCGQSAAIRTGVTHARAPVVVTLD